MTAQQAFPAGAPRVPSPQTLRGPQQRRRLSRVLSRAWLRGAVAVWLGAAALPVSAAQLNGLALEAAPAGAQLVLNMSGVVGARLFQLKAPERTVLDLDHTQLAPGVTGPRAGGIVQAVRVGRQPNGVLRVVLQLAGSYPAHASWSSSSHGRLLVVSVGTLTSPPAAAVSRARTAPSTSSSAANIAPSSAASSSANSAAEPSEPAAEAVTAATAGADGAENAVPVPMPTPEPGRESGSEPGPAPDAAPRTVRPAHAPAAGARDIIVAVDAGHGGVDPGAIGHGGTREKDVTLAIASLLAARINREPGMRAILTRSSDEFVVLRDRIQRARAAKADMFVSVHADAARNSEASGASVYVLSEKGASNENARWLAERENAADLLGGVKLDNKDRTLASVLLDLSQTATISSSIDAAERVLACLDGVEEVRRSQVQQAGFVVLKSPDIPSMLVETAYISNPQDEVRLRRPAEQQRLAEAIFTGVRRYFVANPPQGTRLSALTGAARSAGQPRKKA